MAVAAADDSILESGTCLHFTAMHRNLISLRLLRNDAFSLTLFRVAVILSPPRKFL